MANQYNSYYLYQKYEKRGNQSWLPCYPNIFSVDGDGTMPLVLKQENDQACGYIPPGETMYRWINLDPSVDYYCLECGNNGYKISGIKESGQTFSSNCNNSTTLIRTNVPNGVVYAKIGRCVTEISPYSESAGNGDGAFQNRVHLVGVEIPNTVTRINNYSFAACESLTNCVLPDSVTSIGNAAFFGCIAMEDTVLWNTITHIGTSAFTECDSLRSINIPSGLTTIPGYCFRDCGALTEIIIPNNIHEIGEYAFSSCIGLVRVNIGNGVTSIGNNAFSWSNALVSITINAVSPPVLGNYAFNDTNNCPIYVPSGSVNIYKSASGWSTYADRIQAITS